MLDVLFFFFQAEDGIRDLVRSRGLGDVYKRQQVLYPKDLSLIPMWADVYPGARVFEAGTGSGALTMALLRAVGPTGLVVTYEARDDFARTALTNIERYMGCLLYTSPSPRDRTRSRMPSSA